ncbi:MAG: hypothetical protein J7L23_04410 [Candidatus Diapherotrites archaeon]|nr:hypothetical protein [Candidatus Diapherotrites archaeon]
MKNLVCAICGSKLHGVSKSTAKTRTRPERLFGGILCHKCVEQVITYKTRVEDGLTKPKDIDIRYRKYVNQLMGKE